MIRVWPGVKGAITFIYILGMGKRVGVDQKGLDRGKKHKNIFLKRYVDFTINKNTINGEIEQS